jgi:hypothetical protein
MQVSCEVCEVCEVCDVWASVLPRKAVMMRRRSRVCISIETKWLKVVKSHKKGDEDRTTMQFDSSKFENYKFAKRESISN